MSTLVLVDSIASGTFSKLLLITKSRTRGTSVSWYFDVVSKGPKQEE